MTNNEILKRKNYTLIFIAAVAARLLWAFLSGLGPEAGADFDSYNTFSDNILAGLEISIWKRSFS